MRQLFAFAIVLSISISLAAFAAQSDSSWTSEQWKTALKTDGAAQSQADLKFQNYMKTIFAGIAKLKNEGKNPFEQAQKMAHEDVRDFLATYEKIQSEHGRPQAENDGTLLWRDAWKRYVLNKTRWRTQLQARIELLRFLRESEKEEWIEGMQAQRRALLFVHVPGTVETGVEQYRAGVGHTDAALFIKTYLEAFSKTLAHAIGFTDLPKKNFVDTLDQKVERLTGRTLVLGSRYASSLYIELDKMVVYAEGFLNPVYYQVTCKNIL